MNISMADRPKVRYWLPGAAVNEDDLRQEIRTLFDRGFGGLEVVVLQSVPQDVLLSQDGWGTKKWDRITEILNDETDKLGMSLDLAAGPGWPIASPVLQHADDSGTLTELTYGITEVRGGGVYKGPVPERRTVHEEGTPVLLTVLAYKMHISDPNQTRLLGTRIKTVFGEREYRLPLEADTYTDLRPYMRDGMLTWSVPGSSEDRWLIFSFFRQPAVQKINGGHTYVVDHLSREGVRAVRDYWDPILSSHPYSAMESIFCDSLEYHVAADWTPGFPEEFMKRRGYDLLPYLPFIGMVNTFPAGDVPAFPSYPEEIREQVNHDYSEVLTQLYCEYHLAGLEEMAEEYSKTVRYQVAYNKPFEEERCGLYVGIPENEALGRAQFDGQRLMAAASHFGRKARYSFECAAEFGQCYGQDYEDLMWWIKRSLMAGMNAQVLHGASYSGDVSGTNPESSLTRSVRWPGYEGFGKYVSNNWNRTPDIPHARGCLDAVSRMNHIFRKNAKVDIAIFRQAYENNGNGPDFYLYGDDGLLQNLGYSYEFVSEFMLHLPEANVSEGILDKEGAAYRALIVPEQAAMSETAMKRILALAESGLPVVLEGKAPEFPFYFGECTGGKASSSWKEARDRLYKSENTGIARADTLAGVPEALKQLHVRPRAALFGEADVMTAVRRGDAEQCTWYILYGYNRIHTGEGFIGPGNARPEDVKPVYHRPGKCSAVLADVWLEGQGNVKIYDPWADTFAQAPFFPDGKGHMRGQIRMEEDEMVILCLDEREEVPACRLKHMRRPAGNIVLNRFSFYAFGPERSEEISFLRSRTDTVPGFSAELSGPEALKPWADMDSVLEYAAGTGVYEGIINIVELPAGDQRLFLSLGDVRDTFVVRVNGKEAAFPDQVMKRTDLTGLVHYGENRIEVRVVSNLHNKLIGRAESSGIDGVPMPSYVPEKYGICPTKEKPMEVYIEG